MMQITRRPLLLGLAAVGAGLSGPGVALARRPASAVTVLLAGGPGDGAFLAGVRAAGGRAAIVRLSGLDGPSVAAARASFAPGGPRTIIGLADDAAAVVIVALARAAGASQTWSGRHTGALLSDRAVQAYFARTGFALARRDLPAGASADGRGGLISFSFKI